MKTLAREVGLIGLLALVGCGEDDTFPILVQSGAHGAAASGTTTRIVGRVCLLADPQILTACSITGAGGLTVSIPVIPVTTADGPLPAVTTTTLPDGTFSMVV